MPEPAQLPAPDDPLDFTDKYNTPLSVEQQPAYDRWAKQIGQNPAKGKYDYDLQGAFLSGAGTSKNGHLTDQFKKPNHPTFSDESQYNGLDGYVGGKWTNAGYVPSKTNLEMHPASELHQYFQSVERETPLLSAQPVPAPTGRNGQYRIRDFSSGTTQVKPAPAPPRPRFYTGP